MWGITQAGISEGGMEGVGGVGGEKWERVGESSPEPIMMAARKSSLVEPNLCEWVRVSTSEPLSHDWVAYGCWSRPLGPNGPTFTRRMMCDAS